MQKAERRWTYALHNTYFGASVNHPNIFPYICLLVTKKKEPVQKKPTRLQMIDYIRKSVTSIDNVCAYLKVEKIEAATTEQIEAVYKELKRRNESNNTGDKWS